MAREDHDVPPAVRAEVLARDGRCCRVCGRYVDIPALHHIEYRSEGGPNTPENLITIGWLPGHDCHLSVVHADKKLWQPILKLVVASPPAVTAFAIRRQQLRRPSPNARSHTPARPLVGWPLPSGGPVGNCNPSDQDLRPLHEGDTRDR